MKKMFALSVMSLLPLLPASALAQARTPKKPAPLPPEFRSYSVAMWILGIAIVLLLGVASPAAAQTGRLGTPNLDRGAVVGPSGAPISGRALNQPVSIIRPVPGGPFIIVPQGTPGSRETIPFTDEPHSLNNAHPMLPSAGLGYVVQYLQVPAQQVELQVYVPGAGSFSGGLEPQTVEIPGYVVTETTAGYIYPQRWGLQQVTAGVYQWVALPQQFQPK